MTEGLNCCFAIALKLRLLERLVLFLFGFLWAFGLQKYSSIAQSVERMTVNHDVTGSSPVWGATFYTNGKIRNLLYAPLAQLVEQLTLNQWVQGSSPWRCTIVFLDSSVGRAHDC